MQAESCSSAQSNLEQPPAYPQQSTVIQVSQQTTANGARHTHPNSDGEESLTPRQEPQGEESRLLEASSPQHPNIATNQFLRQASVTEEKPASVRHKPQSNSVPAQSSQYIYHNVKPSQSRSLDSSTGQPDSMFYGMSAPQYRSPPLYGAVTAVGKVAPPQDKLSNNPLILCSGKAQHRNGNMLASYQQMVENTSLPPPPEYPGNRADVRRSYEVLDRVTAPHPSSLSQSSSQPELTNVSSIHVTTSNNGSAPQYNHNIHSDHSQQQSADQQQDFAAIAARASKMVDILSEENKGLRNELESYYRKVSKLQKFEFELQNVHEAHDNLVRSSVKKEGLEKAIRSRQDMDIKKLEQTALKGQEKIVALEKRLADQGSMLDDISKLISQHEETISHLTKLTSEQKDVIDHSNAVIKQMTSQLHEVKSQSNLYSEELEAYKSNASITMEEESEVKMAALTQNTKDSERIICEAQTEKLKYMDEAHQACKKVALLEAKLKALQASCAEKDAIVRVLQRRQRSNLSGRGQANPIPNPVHHARRISEPTSSCTDESHFSVSLNASAVLPAAADDGMQTQTWQV